MPHRIEIIIYLGGNMTEEKKTIEQALAKQTTVIEELVKKLEDINSTLSGLSGEAKEIKDALTRRDRRK